MCSDDQGTLQENGITPGAMIHMVLQLRGGFYSFIRPNTHN